MAHSLNLRFNAPKLARRSEKPDSVLAYLRIVDIVDEMRHECRDGKILDGRVPCL